MSNSRPPSGPDTGQPRGNEVFLTSVRRNPLPTPAARSASLRIKAFATRSESACSRRQFRLETPSTRRNDHTVRLGFPRAHSTTQLASFTANLNWEMNRRLLSLNRRASGVFSHGASLPSINAPSAPAPQTGMRVICDELQKRVAELKEMQDKGLSAALASSGGDLGSSLPSPSSPLRAEKPKTAGGGGGYGDSLGATSPIEGEGGTPPARPRRRPRTDKDVLEQLAELAKEVSPVHSPRRREFVDRNIEAGGLQWKEARSAEVLHQKGRERDCRILEIQQRKWSDEGGWVQEIETKLRGREERLEREKRQADRLRKEKRTLALHKAVVAALSLSHFATALQEHRAERRSRMKRAYATQVLSALLGPHVRKWKSNRMAREMSLNVLLTVRRSVMRNAMARRARSVTIVQNLLYMLKFQLRFKHVFQKLRTQIVFLQRWWRAHRAMWNAQVRTVLLQWGMEEKLQERRHFKAQVVGLRDLCLLKELAQVVAAVRAREGSADRGERQLLNAERLCSRDRTREQAQRLTFDDLRHVAVARGLDPKGLRAANQLLDAPTKADAYSQLLSLNINQLSDDALAAAAADVGAWNSFVSPSVAARDREIARSLPAIRRFHRQRLEVWRQASQMHREEKRQPSSPRRAAALPRPAVRIAFPPAERSLMWCRALVDTFEEMGDSDGVEAANILVQKAEDAVARSTAPPTPPIPSPRRMGTKRMKPGKKKGMAGTTALLAALRLHRAQRAE
eukprot:Hpha_TRINITY_DN29728_c0_g1::TRINITY_DN29728_c0_g1_i1::g.2660::m.2660